VLRLCMFGSSARGKEYGLGEKTAFKVPNKRLQNKDDANLATRAAGPMPAFWKHRTLSVYVTPCGSPCWAAPGSSAVT
jgi:hypothetical protein